MGQGPQRQDTPEAYRILCAQVHQVAVQFPEVLQLILDLTAFRPPVDYRLPPEEGERYAIYRQGQNSIAAALLHYIAKAREGDDHVSTPVREPDFESAGWGSPGGPGGGDAGFWHGGAALR
jgi:hypothetical protein